MISLLLETSTELGMIALFKENELIYHGRLPPGLQNSAHLFSEITKGFKETHLLPKDINLIMVGVGPGSYTGIRVAAMTAKSLSFALQIPLIGVSSLEGFIPSEEGSFGAIIDARIGGVYLQTAFLKEGVVTLTSKPLLLPLEKAAAFLKDVKTLVTPNHSRLKSIFENISENSALVFEESEPDPKAMFNSCLIKYLSKEYSLNQELDLLYLRKTQAEIERE